jgi:subtilisin family serine protease
MARLTGVILLLAVHILSAAIIPGHYVVELSTPSVSEQSFGRLPGRGRARLNDAAAGTQRTRIRGEQQQMRTRFEQRSARVLGSVDTVANAMFVQLDGDDARTQLQALPGVKRVVPMREFYRVMDRAVVVHKVTDAWAQLGDGHAGEGVKVAIIDTGVEAAHPAFQDSGLTAPEGFPRTTYTSDEANTNGKVIVARSYVSMLPRRDSDTSARDRVGHGTALAAVVAGVRATGPLATITGIAPKAWIGSYKVFGTPGVNDATSDAAILKAIDDAVADGMDVINLSLGSNLAPRLDEDLEVQAIERATRAGVVVVVSAGNNGPGMNTMASPGTAPSAITVGAVTNDRTFGASVDVPGLGTFLALTGSGPSPGAPVTAAVADVAAIDGSGLACGSLPAGSLNGTIALILRGACNFSVKLGNAQQAGAVAALVYATEQAPDPIGMSVGTATLPAEMVGNADGVAIKALLTDGPRVATLSFTIGPVTVAANRRSSFSAAGPNVDTAIKPDLVAVGSNVYTATQRLDRNGDMYSADGFVLVDGTSFSSPIVAGAVALIKSARPGLTADQYRSLIINNTIDAYTGTGALAGMQVAGSGSLDALAALNSTVTAYPASLGFGAGGADPRMRSTLTLTNLGTAEDTFYIETSDRGGNAGPVADTVQIAAGASAPVPVTWNADGLTTGAHEGFLLIRSATTGRTARVPYWYDVASSTPAAISVLSTTSSGRRNGLLRDAILFRVLDSSGLNLAGADPTVTVVAGDGVARNVVSYDSEVPGLFGVTVQLGLAPGVNTFRIQAGETSTTVSISGQ